MHTSCILLKQKNGEQRILDNFLSLSPHQSNFHQRIESDVYEMQYGLTVCVAYPHSAGTVAVDFAVAVGKGDVLMLLM